MSDKRTYSLNDFYFSNLTSQSAYYLGFIAADGHITNYENVNRLIINKCIAILDKMIVDIHTINMIVNLIKIV